MRNPFKTYQEYVKKTPRVAFDKSHRNNLTIPMGLLVPDLVLDVVTGDSMSLDASFAFNINPMVFPVQTPLRISQYFFYIPWRLTWEHYEDCRYNNKPDLVHPYILRPASWFKTGTLADYMGLPTTMPVSDHQPVVYPLKTHSLLIDKMFQVSGNGNVSASLDAASFGGQCFGVSNQTGARSATRAVTYFVDSAVIAMGGYLLHRPVSLAMSTRYHVQPSVPANYVLPACRVVGVNNNISYSVNNSINVLFSYRSSSPMAVSLYVFAIPSGDDAQACCLSEPYECTYSVSGDTYSVILPTQAVDAFNALFANGHPSYDLVFFFNDDKDYSVQSCFFYDSAVVYSDVYVPIDISTNPALNPFCKVGVADPALRINALPFRAYEMTCNCYFRNDRVDPFVLNGEVQYNNFLTTKADGADATNYKLWHRNWELDRFTSCLKTPQQGTAPIVGADLRTITFESDGQQYRFAYVTEADGHTVAGGEFETEDVPGNVKRAAMDLVTAGFNIESLREANAMQRYLERNIRRGLRYKDQVKSHTGVDLDAALLDEPEFLGGFSHYVDVRSVTCSSPSGEVPLADIAGQASAFRKAFHKISKFFREDGVVLGLVCITPEPVYSQCLEKFYLRSSPLDYYNSEFSHLGMQPVPYAEVAPIQMCAEMAAGGSRTYQSVFGYNRPNYDMVSAVDECHGLMRTTDSDFIMMRQFNGVPDLSADFIKVKGSHLNDVFSVTDEDGHIAKGQVAFQIFMKRPVPAVGEPRLE